MRSPDTRPTGWDWLDGQADNRSTEREVKELFEATFAGRAGQLALAHLKLVFLDRRISPSSSNEMLRHFEGARAAIAYIDRLARPSPEQNLNALSNDGETS